MVAREYQWRPILRRCAMPRCPYEGTVKFGLLTYCSECCALVCENLALMRTARAERDALTPDAALLQFRPDVAEVKVREDLL